ncbi:hypothetical protein ZOSMA_141G00350, partial [Zostera marina]
CDCWK